MLTLYYSPGACSLSAHIALLENNIPHQLKKVNLKEHKVDDQDFATINPKNYVPVLQFDNKEVLTEACAILFYIAEHGTLSSMLDNKQNMVRYRLLEALTFVSTELHKSFGPFFNPKFPEESRVIAREKLGKRLDYLESVLNKNAFLTGNQFSVADAYCFVVLRWIKVIDIGLKLDNWPKISGYYHTIVQRDKVKQALAEEELKRY